MEILIREMKKPIINNKHILKNAIITYNNGEKEIFDAILITEKGIFTGVIKMNDNYSEDFIDNGLISKKEIKNIIVFYKEGRSQTINF